MNSRFSKPAKTAKILAGDETLVIEVREPNSALKGQLLRMCGVEETDEGKADASKVDLSKFAAHTLARCAYDAVTKERAFQDDDAEWLAVAGPEFDEALLLAIKMVNPETAEIPKESSATPS
jgi:hypothetical protein